MANSSLVTVGTTPVELYAAPGPQAETVIIDVQSGSTVTVGGSGVTAGQGPQFPVSAAPTSLGQVNGDSIWAVCAAGSAQVSVLAYVSGTIT